MADKLARRKRRMEKRLPAARDGRFVRRMSGAPAVLNTAGWKYERADRAQAIVYGGVPLMPRVARASGLIDAMASTVPILQGRCPYYESDHALNLAMNALCEGTCLEHLERRRNDEAFLNAIETDSIPDPTTAGDFCRRFSGTSVRQLLDAIHRARLNVWRRQSKEFFDEALIGRDGTLTVTTGECQEGLDISDKGNWGDHPLVVSLANTGEVLSIVNRSGHRRSQEGAADEADRAIRLCREAGFQISGCAATRPSVRRSFLKTPPRQVDPRTAVNDSTRQPRSRQTARGGSTVGTRRGMCGSSSATTRRRISFRGPRILTNPCGRL